MLSGGQDSAVCLAWALTNYDAVETLGFSYGQRHSVELECRPKLRDAISAAFPVWAPRLGPDHVLDLSVLGAVSDTALTSDAEIAFGANGLPNTFVPGRNLLFFTLAGRSASGAAFAIWSAACARPITQAIPIAATKRCRR